MLKNAAVPKPVVFSLFKNAARVNNPTIAAEDFKVDIDGAGQANVANPPTSDAAGRVTWQPTQAETNGDIVTLLGNDAAGDEWEPITLVFETQLPTSVEAILVDTAEIGAAGAGLTALGDARLANLDAAISSRATPAQLSVAISATQAAALATGSLAIVTDYALSQSITSTTTVDLEEAGSKLYLAIKEKETDADAAALALIEKTEGLLYLAQAAAADATLGSLTISGSAGAWSILIWLDETATADLRNWKGNRYYELKHVPATGDPTLISTGKVVISRGIVRATS